MAVNAGAVATPEALVIVVAKAPLPVKLPVAPTAGTLKFTVTPLIGFPLESTTVACKAAENVLLILALCGVPAVAVTLAGTGLAGSNSAKGENEVTSPQTTFLAGSTLVVRSNHAPFS